MRYFKIMFDGATLCCIETALEINFINVDEVLKDLRIKNGSPIEKIIEVDKNEAYEWYDVVEYKGGAN